MGNVTAKDVHAAVDKSDVSKLEKILEAKPELIDELSAVSRITFSKQHRCLVHVCILPYSRMLKKRIYYYE